MQFVRGNALGLVSLWSRAAWGAAGSSVGLASGRGSGRRRASPSLAALPARSSVAQECGLTRRSSRPAPAGSVSLVRGTWCIIANQAYAACRSGRLNSNVRRGIDREVEKIFLQLAPHDLESLLSRYGHAHGQKAEAYARDTYEKWKAGAVKMSGQTAGRLLDLLPPLLAPSVRFDLVRKLRERHFSKKTIRLQSTPATWRTDLIKPIQELVAASSGFALPADLLEKARWLADGDAAAAQRLLAAAEQEEAAVRVAYIDAELRRVEALIQNIDTTRQVTHTLKLPQGDIILRVELPARTLLQRLTGWMR
jgi:hypothetical protein